MATLYRTYRPMSFDDVTEQRHVLQTLTNQILANTVSHAYLFSGPRGVGKTTIARLLAKTMNCTGRKSDAYEPCNQCGACIAFAEGRYMDTVEMDAASHTGVDNVRDNIIENIRFVPQHGAWKIFIIDEVHMLSGAAFNALLKTLEEPPAHALFILATTEPHKIPATIASRCQSFDFHRITNVKMIERLSMIAEREHVTIDAEVLQHIARASEGCLRDAESLLEQVFALGGEKITLETASAVLPKTNIALCVSLVDTLSRGDLSATLKELNAFVDGGGSVRHATDELLDYVRTLLFVTLGDAPTTTYGATVDAALVDVAAHMTPHAVRRLLDGVLAARSRVSLTSLPQLPLEIAFAEFGDADIQKVKPSADPVVSPAKFSPHITSDDSPVQRDRAQHAEKASINNETKETPKIEEQQPVTFALEDLQNKWSRCCDYVADRNVALPLILRNAQPSAVEGNTVTLSFGYGFHADALKEQKNMRLVEDAIAEVMMQRVAIKTTIVATKESQEVASLAAAFGGSVV